MRTYPILEWFAYICYAIALLTFIGGGVAFYILAIEDVSEIILLAIVAGTIWNALLIAALGQVSQLVIHLAQSAQVSADVQLAVWQTRNKSRAQATTDKNIKLLKHLKKVGSD